ncbi:MAG: hypothetical protein GY694_13740 [Gammaproteobacteria bacterium]|nr:hypothetical protein [Gammaproteobacteria bacterium]
MKKYDILYKNNGEEIASKVVGSNEKVARKAFALKHPGINPEEIVSITCTEDGSTASGSSLIVFAVFCFVVTLVCFMSGQSMIEENIFGGSGQTNGVRLVYASYLAGLIGAVFLLAGLLRK